MKFFSILSAALIFVAVSTSTALAQNERPVRVWIKANEALQMIRSGEEISDYCELESQNGNRVSGEEFRKDEMVVSPGDVISWEFKIQGPKKSVEIVSFDFEEQVGENFFLLEGGAHPSHNGDGTWSGTVSPNATNGHKLKYTVIVKIEDTYFTIDPIVTIGGSGGG